MKIVLIVLLVVLLAIVFLFVASRLVMAFKAWRMKGKDAVDSCPNLPPIPEQNCH